MTTENQPIDVIFSEKVILAPLYKKIKINTSKRSYSFFPSMFSTIECYCKSCNTRRIFKFQGIHLDNNPYYPPIGGSTVPPTIESTLKNITFFQISAKGECDHHLTVYFMKIDEQNIMKIGQYPSIYDLNEEIHNKPFLKGLGKEYVEYYTKACSLYSFGACIGALTYLRRIFENLLIESFKLNELDTECDFESFNKARMEDKITILKDYLPDIIHNQGFNKIYTKISHGIHNLTEVECEVMFPILKNGIEEIMIEKIVAGEKAARQKKLATLLNEI